MALTYIWVFFILASFVMAIISLISTGQATMFNNMVKSMFDMAKVGFDISLGLVGVMTLWLGIMKIGEEAGILQKLAQIISPIFHRLFPELPKNHPAFASMLMNISANMLGLDDAATPFGLKAMDDLQKANKTKDRASNAQIMFLVMNTSGLCLIPVNIMVIRAQMGASNPTDVFLPILLATFFSTVVGVVFTAIIQKINLFDKYLIGFFGGLTTLVFALLWYLKTLDQETVAKISTGFSSITIITILALFVGVAIKKGINVYNTFIVGAKDGFKTAISIVPHLVGILVALGLFRTSGLLDVITNGLSHFFALFGINTDFTKALPVGIMKPISGSGSRGLMVDNIKTYGVDSFIGRLSSIFNGSTDTTFYILAVYFGYVNIKNFRHAVVAGLIADLAGIVASIIIGYIFFY